MEKMSLDLQSTLTSVTRLQLIVMQPLQPLTYHKHPAAWSALLSPAHQTATPVQRLCGRLAAALPALQNLSLTGTSKEVGLKEFSSHCSHLNRLRVQAGTVPIHLFSEISCFPNLHHLTICGGQQLTATCLQSYVNGVLGRLTGQGPPLQVLDLQCASMEGNLFDSLSCIPKASVWHQLPATLTKFRNSGGVYSPLDLLMQRSFMSRLQALTLWHSNGTNLFDLLSSATRLEYLHIMTAGVSSPPLLLTYIEKGRPTPATKDVARFKEHLQRGLTLVCAAVRLRGSSADILQLMSWLHPQPAVIRLVMPEMGGLTAEEMARMHSLTQQLFPNLQLSQVRADSDLEGVDEESSDEESSGDDDEEEEEEEEDEEVEDKDEEDDGVIDERTPPNCLHGYPLGKGCQWDCDDEYDHDGDSDYDVSEELSY